MIRPILILTFLLGTFAPARAQETATLPLAPMAANANPAFEVATIRPSRPGAIQSDYIHGHRVGMQAYRVTDMICLAYGLQQTQVIDAPAWFSDRYDVEGVPDVEGQPSLHQMQLMVQKLLTARFALRFHHETRMLSLYAVTLAKGGPKLARSTADPNGLPDLFGSSNGSQRTMKFINMTMEDFTLALQFQMNRPVVDRTGLTGHYDFTLHWFRYDDPPDAHTAPEPSPSPGFLDAIQQQAGLKLEAKKDLADVLIIDHAEKPSEN